MISVAGFICSCAATGRLAAQWSPSTRSPFPPLLPPASNFRLTLQEDLHSNLPLGPSCGGAAARTLHCRAFILTLTNMGSSTVHIEDSRSYSVSLDRSRLGMTVTGGGASVPSPDKDIRLQPGESIQRSARGAGPGDPFSGEIEPGRYPLHAEWILHGCTENPAGKECLHHLDDGRPFYPAQEPVAVLSSEITSDEPQLNDLGDVKLALELTAHPGKIGNAAGDCTRETNPIDCTVFHLTTRNFGQYPIRYAVNSCGYSGPRPEYRTGNGKWQDLAALRQCVICSACLSGLNPIFPGTKEVEFALETLGRGFDTKMLQEPGEYYFRFVFQTDVCIASPDASFCLSQPEDGIEIVSNEVEVNTPLSNVGIPVITGDKSRLH
jgi:hypothetical protein